MSNKYISTVVKEFVYGGHILSIGATAIVITVVVLQNLPVNLFIFFIPYLICQVVYSYNHYREITIDIESNPERSSYINQQKKWAGVVVLVYVITLAVLTLFSNLNSILLVSFIILGGILYTEYFKKIISQYLAGFKNIYTSLFWAVLIFFVPAIYSINITPFYLYFFIFVFLRLMVNTIFFDIKDIESDRAENLKTFAVILGKQKTLISLQIINLLTLLPIILGILNGYVSSISIVLGFLILYSIFYLTYANYLEGRKLRNLSYIVVDAEYIFWPIVIIIVKIIFNI